MNEEEKRAIEKIKEIIKCFYYFPNPTSIELKNCDCSTLETILNLIEKLQKENEELKAENEYNKLLLDTNKNFTIDKKNGIYKWNVIEIQKVKDKIEELKNVSYAEELEDIMNRENYSITELVQYVLKELLDGNDTNVGSI